MDANPLPKELTNVPEEVLSERLLMRAPHRSDADVMHSAIEASLPELKRWLPWAHELQTRDGVEVFLVQAAAKFLTREDLLYLIFLRETNAFVGRTGLMRIDWSVPKFEIGCWIHSAYAGQKFASEAVGAMTQVAVEQLGARRVELRCDSENRASVSIARRLGYTLDGVLKNHERAADDRECLSDIMVFSKTQ